MKIVNSQFQITNEKAGGLKKIIPPHLHYFKKEFFKNLNRELIELNK